MAALYPVTLFLDEMKSEDTEVRPRAAAAKSNAAIKVSFDIIWIDS